MKVLDIGLTMEDEGAALFGEQGNEPRLHHRLAPEPFRYPVVRAEVRVAVTEPVAWSDPKPEAVERAVELLLRVEREPWWRRWLASEAEKSKGMRWRVKS